MFFTRLGPAEASLMTSRLKHQSICAFRAALSRANTLPQMGHTCLSGGSCLAGLLLLGRGGSTDGVFDFFLSRIILSSSSLSCSLCFLTDSLGITRKRVCFVLADVLETSFDEGADPVFSLARAGFDTPVIDCLIPFSFSSGFLPHRSGTMGIERDGGAETRPWFGCTGGGWGAGSVVEVLMSTSDSSSLARFRISSSCISSW